MRRKNNFTRITLIAHNCSGFDAQFIQRVILNGSKIEKIDMYRIRFIDLIKIFRIFRYELTEKNEKYEKR